MSAFEILSLTLYRQIVDQIFFLRCTGKRASELLQTSDFFSSLCFWRYTLWMHLCCSVIYVALSRLFQRAQKLSHKHFKRHTLRSQIIYHPCHELCSITFTSWRLGLYFKHSLRENFLSLRYEISYIIDDRVEIKNNHNIFLLSGKNTITFI